MWSHSTSSTRGPALQSGHANRGHVMVGVTITGEFSAFAVRADTMGQRSDRSGYDRLSPDEFHIYAFGGRSLDWQRELPGHFRRHTMKTVTGNLTGKGVAASPTL